MVVLCGQNVAKKVMAYGSVSGISEA